MSSLLVAISWTPYVWGDGVSPTSKAFVRGLWVVRSERTMFLTSSRPRDVDCGFVAAGDPRHDGLVEVRRELWCPGCELGDGVTDRSGHVEAGLLGRGAGPSGPATQAGGSLEFGDQRITFGAPLRLPLGVAAHRRSVDLVVELGETAAVLPERLLVEDGAGVGAGQRGLARRPDQRQCRYGLVWSCDQLAQVLQALQIRHVQVRAVELDAPDAILRSQNRTLRRFGLRRLPEELCHQPGGLDLTHLFRQRETLTKELRAPART